MSDPRSLSIKDFTYFLPEERIARYPLSERDASKLLVYEKGIITEDLYRNLANYLPEESFLLFNDTKVVEARLLFQKPTGGVIEIFCLEPNEIYPDITMAMLQQGKVLWQCLVGGASKWKHGDILKKEITHESENITLEARYLEKQTDSFTIQLTWSNSSLTFADILHLFGAVPLPPYIKRKAEQDDVERYQTVYAHYDGSVAAPTAGLHFTERIFNSLHKKNISHDFITLHVGAGTFKPVKSDTMKDHKMHSEQFSISKKTLQSLINKLDKNIIPVGTTTLRTLECLYWMGVKQIMGHGNSYGEVSQWEVYDLLNTKISAKESLESILEMMETDQVENMITETSIIIAPGYQFKIANGIITNFHQPQSTLLLLVAAAIGNDWKLVYDYALKNDFRFLSYGDGSLLWLNQA